MKSTSTALRWLLAVRGVAAGIDATYANNPAGTTYMATLQASSSIQGYITAGTGEQNITEFDINFTNLPSEGGPFCTLIQKRWERKADLAQCTIST